MTETKKSGKTQSLLVATNVILFAAVIVLFYMQFHKPSAPAGLSEPAIRVVNPADSELRLAYINTDIIMQRYERVPEMIASLEASTRTKEASLRRRQSEFEVKVNDFQRKMQSGSITMEIAQITEQQLMLEQQEIMELRESYRDELSRQEMEMELELFNKISSFLEEFNKTRNFDIIFNYTRGSSIYLAGESFNITDEIVELLNAEHRLRKPRQ
jgi:outer membrane protein